MSESKKVQTQDERRAHLLAWIRMLPDDVEDPMAGMVKLLRHLVADMDALVEALCQGEKP